MFFLSPFIHALLSVYDPGILIQVDRFVPSLHHPFIAISDDYQADAQAHSLRDPGDRVRSFIPTDSGGEGPCAAAVGAIILHTMGSDIDEVHCKLFGDPVRS